MQKNYKRNAQNESRHLIFTTTNKNTERTQKHIKQ